MIEHKRKIILLKFLLLLSLISAYNNARERACLTRSALLSPALSPWHRLMDFGDNNSFLVITGMTRPVFAYLEQVLFRSHQHRRNRGVGRPPLLDSKAQLGLYLTYIASRMGVKHLCLIFGITPSTCSSIINKMLRLVVRKLSRNIYSKISFPTEEKLQQFEDSIAMREPMARGVVGFMDGLSLHTECTSEAEVQNAFYNGYHSDTMVNNVLAFGPDGKVFVACLNFPGSWHDSAVVMEMIAKLKHKLRGRKICVDQGFPRTGLAFDVLVGPYSEKSVRTLSPLLLPLLLAFAAVYVSLRQASEWGMRSLQASFPRLKLRLPSNSEKRKLVILSIILIHNLRTELVGLNQIATVFNPEYERYINLGTYDRISRYYYQVDQYE